MAGMLIHSPTTFRLPSAQILTVANGCPVVIITVVAVIPSSSPVLRRLLALRLPPLRFGWLPSWARRRRLRMSSPQARRTSWPSCWRRRR